MSSHHEDHYMAPKELVRLYSLGLFPMAEHAHDEEVKFILPEERGVLRIDRFHIPRRLKKLLRQCPFTIKINHDFSRVIDECARSTTDRPETWINSTIRNSFILLHAAGMAHSVECYDKGTGSFAGGLYGLTLGRVFFGESMVTRMDGGSKIALIALAARLWAGGYHLIDLQLPNPIFDPYGGETLSKDQFSDLLSHSLSGRGSFFDADSTFSSSEELIDAFVQSRTHTSNTG